MSVLIPASESVAAIERRSQRIQVECPRGGAPVLQAFRQVSTLDGSGAVIASREFAAEVRRTIAGPVLAETVTLADNTVLTAAQVMEAVARFADKWDQEDQAPLA